MADTFAGPGFDILLEDGPALVVNKPGGVLTQAPPGIDSLESRVKSFLKVRDNKPGKIYLGVPHRLDRPVSGAIVFAKHSRAARRIAEQFEGRLIKKKYLAVVEGSVRDDTGTWRHALRKVPGEPRAEVVETAHPEGREAVLHYRVLRRFTLNIREAEVSATLLEIELETGRMHQIRIQAASCGHPVLGDEQYGSQLPFGPPLADPRQRWIALHARLLAFRHPMTRQGVEVTAPLHAHWDIIPFPVDR